MNSLRTALSNAAKTGRIPSHDLAPRLYVRGECDRLGFPKQVFLRKFVEVLGLPGNFMPGQPLCISREQIDPYQWNQTDVFCVGLDTSVWKFWSYKDDAWMNGVIRPNGTMPAGAPLEAYAPGSGTIEGKIVALQVFASSMVDGLMNILNQDHYGNWDAWLVRVDHPLPTRGHFAHWGGPYSVFAVDNSGTLQLFGENAEYDTLTGPLVGTPISSPNFAPPGAPIAVDYRIKNMEASTPAGGPVNVFLVGNDGRLWVFESEDGVTWSSSPMPNPNGISLTPGAFIATGYQSGTQQQLGQTIPIGYCQLDVFVVDKSGTLQMWWESLGSAWNQGPLTAAGLFPSGAPIATGGQAFEFPWAGVAIGGQLDVFVVDFNGKLRRSWVYKSGPWNYDQLPDSIALPAGAYLATGYQAIDDNGAPHQLDVFAVGTDGRIAIFWQTDENPWTCEAMPGSDLPVPGRFM